MTLSGPTEARVGEMLAYECATGNSNPPATIQWVVGNRTSGLEDREPGWETDRTEASPDGGWVTRSRIRVALGPDDRKKMVVCRAVNSELNDVKSDSKILSVICELQTRKKCRMSHKKMRTTVKVG